MNQNPDKIPGSLNAPHSMTIEAGENIIHMINTPVDRKKAETKAIGTKTSTTLMNKTDLTMMIEIMGSAMQGTDIPKQHLDLKKLKDPPHLITPMSESEIHYPIGDQTTLTWPEAQEAICMHTEQLANAMAQLSL